MKGRAANLIAGTALWSPRFRARLVRLLGAQIDRTARIYPYCRFIGRTDLLSVGAHSFLNLGVVIGSNAAVSIGSRVAVGPGVHLLPTTHEIGPSTHRAGGGNVSSPIRIGDGVWIGAGAIVLGGVTIGHGSVVAAGAVVTGDLEPDGLYGGTPARLIRRLDDQASTPAQGVSTDEAS